MMRAGRKPRRYSRDHALFLGDIDARWFPEACLSHPRNAKGFYTVQTLWKARRCRARECSASAHGVEKNKLRQGMGGVTPPEVADNLGRFRQHFTMVSELRTKQG